MPPKQKYRLQTVLDIRERAKKEAAQFLILRRQQLAAAEVELERCRNAVLINLELQKQQQNVMFTEINRGAEAKRAVDYRIYLNDLRDIELDLRAKVVKQEQAVKQAEAEVEKALDLLAESSKEVKVIEKHKETWNTNRKIDTERREQKLNDEIGAILFQTRKK